MNSVLAQTKLTFGINNVFDARAPLSADWYQAYDPSETNEIGRFFWVQIEKKF
jgi:outer membrane receptor protein involved in Fe transport